VHNFKVTVGTDGVSVLSFESGRSQDCIDFALANDIRRFSLFDYYHPDLSLLLPLTTFCEGLILNDTVDFSDICLFERLTLLGATDNKRNTLNLECFPLLETLACSITIRLVGLSHCKRLKNLTVSYYNPENGNLHAIPNLPSLERFSILKTRIKTLDGVEKLQHLKEIDIYSAPKLELIGALQDIRALQEVRLEACKNVLDYEILGKINSLVKIQLTNAGQTTSLKFVSDLRNLRFLSFVGTNILDGDLNYCKGLEFVGFDDKKHYNLKMIDFAQRRAHHSGAPRA
jgi:hypothetical protein